ncbi:hypothetical protein QE429_002787 [Bacillus sp. SORGH_AS 510]|nr:hypothetical protein [Bacillus sp. SORGH_AS_0510]
MLFHYHFWTPNLEEMENFYLNQGFRVSQRLGKYKGEFQSFNPPLSWDEFREQGVLFRIIEMKKGNVNISFGFGKRCDVRSYRFSRDRGREKKDL